MNIKLRHWLACLLPFCVIMDVWSAEHRAFIVETFLKNGESVVKTQRAFRLRFNVGRHGAVPTRNTILRWIQNFRLSSSASKKKPPGHVRSVRTPENIDRVRVAVTRSPHRSARRHAIALGLSNRSVRRILHLDLKFHAYKVMIVQQLNERDYVQRRAFAERMMEMLTDEVVMFMSDEAHFHLNGYVNKQNCRYWSPENPKELHEHPLHCAKVTVWCAVSRYCVIGPYFFEENGNTVTVNSERYVQMLRTFLQPELRRRLRGIDRQVVWFQQDGATAHTAENSMTVLRRMFPGHIISRRGDIPWPPRSPDLTVCDYFLWGYLKSKVYVNRPQTTDDLKIAIAQEIANIDGEMLERATRNFRERLEECIQRDGHHLNDIIFKTT